MNTVALIMYCRFDFHAFAPAGAAVFGEETVALSVALRTMLSSSLEAKDWRVEHGRRPVERRERLNRVFVELR